MDQAESKTPIPKASTLMAALKFLTSFKTREERNEILADEANRKRLIPEKDFERYEQLRKNEYHHIKHVRAACKELFSEHQCIHDHTKDEFYIFITVAAFSFNLKTELPQDLWQSELDRHFKAEPHHPEYESLNKEEGLRITDNDIAEMTVDRLSRNLQFNNGNINDEDMRRFEPEFVYDHEQRIEMYRENVKKFKDTVKKVWDDMKPAT